MGPTRRSSGHGGPGRSGGRGGRENDKNRQRSSASSSSRTAASSHVQARREKRQLGGGGGPKSIQDVFEYATEQENAKRTKGKSGRAQRRALANEFDEEDGMQGRRRGGYDDDEVEEEGGSGERRDYGTAPILGDGKNGENSGDDYEGGIASDEDEEIDSDEAFGEGDEEEELIDDVKFTNKDSNRRPRHYKPSDDDDEEEEDDGDDDGDDASVDDADMVDLSKILDQSASESEEEGSDEEEDHEKLQRHMEALGGRGPDASALHDASSAAGNPAWGKRRVLPERIEALPEGEWNAPGRSNGANLTIEDLMRPISGQAGTSLTDLRNSAKRLQPSSADKESAKEAVASRRGGSKLSAPLPTIVRDRLDRSAAYEETKKEVEGWQPTIKRLREAEHLSFPLQPDPVHRPSTSSIAANFKPSNGFEQNIAALLESEGLSEQQVKSAEELKMNERGLSAEEIRQRTTELRKMRELLFREEQKAKRISKIKSKTYRRIARKQKQREEAKAREAGLLVGEENEEDEEEERMKAERLRAKERATLKHKNAGKWAKGMLGGAKGLQDMPEARQAIEDQLLKGEQLRRRIHGHRSDGSDEEGDDDFDDESGSDNDEEGDVRRNAFNEMLSVQAKASGDDEPDGKGIWNMKFMREARKQQARDAEDEINAFAQEIERSDNEDDQEERNASLRSLQVGANPGRMVFSSVPDQKKSTINAARVTDELDSLSSDGPGTTKGIQVRDVRAPSAATNVNKLSHGHSAAAEENPWLAEVSAGSTKLSRKKNEAQVSKEDSAQNRAANRIARHAAKGDDAKREAEEDARLDIDPTAFLRLHRDGQSDERRPKKKTRTAEQDRLGDPSGDPSGDSSDDSDDLDDDEPVQVSRQQPTAMRQRQIVAEAFAGDDVLTDFEAEKEAAIQADAPQEVDTFLAGWGSWGGKGVRTDKRKAEERKRQFVKLTGGVDPKKRKDAGMQQVIINQKQDKKADKYKSKDVPFPYTSRAQYEMAMRNPLGPEWNTRTQHQRLTLPRVVSKPGKAIKPIEKMF